MKTPMQIPGADLQRDVSGEGETDGRKTFDFFMWM